MIRKVSYSTLTLLAFTLLYSCGKQQQKDFDIQGQWHAQLDISPDIIPFQITFKKNKENWSAEIHNGEEVLVYDEVEQSGDSLAIQMGIFDSVIKAKILSEDMMSGVFIKNYLNGYSIPFTAEKTEKNRFSTTQEPTVDFSGRWKTLFVENSEKSYDAIGIFEQDGSKITGTFLTKLGDYRFLEGNVEGNTFYMSAFDGSHAYFFMGSMGADGKIEGKFRSGPSYRESFTAERNEEFELPDAYSLNYLKEGYEKLSFSFPDVNGNMISNEDEQFENKVTLVQLFGTWCPNCMDETKFLVEWHKKNRDRGIEIIALAFESKPDFEYASNRVKKTIERMGAEYTFLIAGESNKEKASQSLPALNQVVAFPTLIYMDKKGNVRHIHTGFNGPGTGAYYERWIEEHEAVITELLQEN